MTTPFLRLATSAPVSSRTDRTIDYVFSDESVARDGHTIAADGWQLDNFLKNPVFLWAHDGSAPPIGRITQVQVAGAQLRGTVKYAEPDEYPFADTIYRLTKGGFLNATSVSWLPIEWKHTTDRSRPGGIDFIRQELLEVSAVPVPALATALATARHAGIDTRPVFEWAERALDLGGMVAIPRVELEALRREAKMPRNSRADAADWKCGAARDLPIDDKSDWDGPAAEKSVFDACGFDGDSPDTAKARDAFLAYDASAPKLKGSYKLPFAKMVDGKLTAVASGIRAAASRLPDADISDEAKKAGRAVIDHYEERMKPEDDEDKRAVGRAVRRAAIKRGLYEVADMCYLLECLEYTFERVAAEADWEQDNSPIPARFRAWLNEGNKMVAAMCAEETSENIKGEGAPEDVADQVDRGVRRALAALGLQRAGKVLSQANQDRLEKIHDHAEETRCMVRDFIDDNCDDGGADADPEKGDGDSEDARALRARKARAWQKRLGLVA